MTQTAMRLSWSQPGRDEVNQIEVRLGVSDVTRFGAFYEAAGGTAIGGNRYKIGETIFAFFRHPMARAVTPAAEGDPSRINQSDCGAGNSLHYDPCQGLRCSIRGDD